MDKKEIKFNFKMATKNTCRFKERSSGIPVIDTLDTQKSVSGRRIPRK
ncbi:MAG: hypothetical protein M1476_07465 [Candidatus Thermoplasmatota archaeon]|nr:hypothetical protein [Candidatus Thermoplasmatota archaeon]